MSGLVAIGVLAMCAIGPVLGCLLVDMRQVMAAPAPEVPQGVADELDRLNTDFNAALGRMHADGTFPDRRKEPRDDA